jgi:tRNA pseudouridine55 synthase
MVEPGVLLIDKPVGLTSFRIVQMVRRILGVKKVGHAGTLDPFATGLLIVCVGRPATKLISHFMEGDKEYEATLKLGVSTDTQDIEGEIIFQNPVPELTEKLLSELFRQFTGWQMQVPPAFSALKHKGKPLYYYARKGIKIEKPARKININFINLLAFSSNELKFNVSCSKGTYIRTLAADFGEALGCGGHLIALKRTKSGQYSIEDSIDGKELDKEGARELLLNKMLSVPEIV